VYQVCHLAEDRDDGSDVGCKKSGSKKEEKNNEAEERF
jgi:hypothetical protein